MSTNHPAYFYIETQKQLDNFTGKMKDAQRIALDVEADSLHSYAEKTCLIQLALDRQPTIVDPLAGIDLREFLAVLSQKPLIVHGGDYDLRMLRLSYGFCPQSQVFDTMLAAQLSGLPKLGLVDLVEQFCQIKLSKKGQKTNWAMRPLTLEQLAYASEDVRYLETIAQRLEERLIELRRENWHTETCQRMVQLTQMDRERDQKEHWRIEGSNFLESKQLVFLRELWLWREEEARKNNRPPFKILGHKELLEMSIAAINPPLRIPHYLRGSRLESLKKAIDKAQLMPPAQWPNPLPKKRHCAPSCPQLMEALRVEYFHLAENLGITPSVLASKALLETIAVHGASDAGQMMKCSPIMHWQAKLLEPIVKRVFSKTSSEKN